VFLVIFGFIALAAAAIGAWFMAGRALRPLKLLADTTDEIGDTGDLSRRLPPVSQDDEVRALTDSFNAMIDGIEAARAERDLTIDSQKRFVADASHELRSPLTSIRANAGFLADRPGASDEDRSDATRDIGLEADRMSHLIDDLLTLARADVRSDDRSDFAPVNIAGVARSVERRARNLRVNVEVHAPDKVIGVGSSDDLAELLWILVDNADRHGGDSVDIGVSPDGNDVRIVVQDSRTGPRTYLRAISSGGHCSQRSRLRARSLDRLSDRRASSWRDHGRKRRWWGCRLHDPSPGSSARLTVRVPDGRFLVVVRDLDFEFAIVDFGLKLESDVVVLE